MLSACAEPAPSRSPSSAHATSVSIGACAPNSASTATTAAAALAALPPRPLASGSPLRMVSATPRRSPSGGQQRLRRDAGGIARGVARQPAGVADDVVDATPDAAGRAVTSSPGEASAKPSTSKPHATFDTVAGANAVTESMGHDSIDRAGRPALP